MQQIWRQEILKDEKPLLAHPLETNFKLELVLVTYIISSQADIASCISLFSTFYWSQKPSIRQIIQKIIQHILSERQYDNLDARFSLKQTQNFEENPSEQNVDLSTKTLVLVVLGDQMRPKLLNT